MDEHDKQFEKPGTFPAENKIAGKRKTNVAKSQREAANFFHKPCPELNGKTRTLLLLEKSFAEAMKDGESRDRDKLIERALGCARDFVRQSSKTAKRDRGPSGAPNINITFGDAAKPPVIQIEETNESAEDDVAE